MSGSSDIDLENQQAKTISLLPLLLQHGRTFDLPIVIPNCKQIVLRDLVYKNRGEDLIKRCKVTINGKDISYNRSKNQRKTYYINGEENSQQVIDVEQDKDLKVSLQVSCHDFNLCHCKEYRFQLNISAIL
jgi:hypothetical protein